MKRTKTASERGGLFGAGAEIVINKRIRRIRRRRRAKSAFIKILAAALVTAAAVWVLFGAVFEIVTVRGVSMSPSLEDGDTVLALRLAEEYEAGDVVIVTDGDGNYYIKRVVGTPGDTVDIDEDTGTVLLNGEPLAESYASGITEARSGGTAFPVTLGEDEYFVLGDNRTVSLDSRDWGAVSAERIQAKVLLPQV